MDTDPISPWFSAIFGALLIVNVLLGEGCARQEVELRLVNSSGEVACGIEEKKFAVTGADLESEFPAVTKNLKVERSLLVCGGDSGKPPVLLLPELPGVDGPTLDYAKSLAAGPDGFTVYVPLLLGDGSQECFVTSALFGYTFNKDWTARDELQGSTYITQWLRRLIREIAARHRDQDAHIGVIGNCLTGALPLALLDNPKVNAVVLAQPTLPLRTFFGFAGATNLAISDREWCAAQRRLNPGASVAGECEGHLPPARAYGVRFELDHMAPREKYQMLKDRLGPGFLGREITSAEYVVPDSAGNPLCKIADHSHSSLIKLNTYRELPFHPSELRRREIRSFLRNPFGFVSQGCFAPEGTHQVDTLPECSKLK